MSDENGTSYRSILVLLLVTPLGVYKKEIISSVKLRTERKSILLKKQTGRRRDSKELEKKKKKKPYHSTYVRRHRSGRTHVH